MENKQPNENEGRGRRKSRVVLAEVKRRLETDADSPLQKERGSQSPSPKKAKRLFDSGNSRATGSDLTSEGES